MNDFFNLDILFHVSQYLSVKDLSNVSKCDHYLHSIITNDKFFTRCKEVSLSSEKCLYTMAKQLIDQSAYFKRFYGLYHDRINFSIYYTVCSYGNTELLEYIDQHHYHTKRIYNTHIEFAFSCTMKHNNFFTMKWLIQKYDIRLDYCGNEILIKLCENGNLEMLQWIILKYFFKHPFEFDINEIIKVAVEKQHHEIADWLDGLFVSRTINYHLESKRIELCI